MHVSDELLGAFIDSYSNTLFNELVSAILESPDNPSQDKMDRIVMLISEIEAVCNETGIDPSNLTGDVKKK